MIKTAIESTIARNKFVNKVYYTEVPAYSALILTGNPSPPTDPGYIRRIIKINFTQNDEHTEKEKEEFKSLVNSRKHELKILGNFAAS